MFQAVLSFLVFMNPIALFIYLLPLKKEVSLRRFINILARATLITYVVYVIFALSGEKLFEILQIDFEAFRVFGGVVVASISLLFIIQGKKSLINTEGEVNRIAAEIALPFMVGAGTITLSIIIGRRLGSIKAAIVILIVLALTFLIIALLASIRHALKPRLKIVFDQNADILLRINSFIIGAIGVDLVIVGIKNLFFASP